ncbi:MAG TPA: permease prefix domain 1-containing protein, partial [Anaeromyxobacteraceae bacterium]|nr:permease prefix domain 1-containing protein [Anaeromyxobacteraceae bacterium]
MASTSGHGALEAQIAEWRSYFRRRQAIREVDVAELEDHLRGQVDSLMSAGLAADEAFLVAVKRMGAVDALSQEFAREHSERLWRQLMVTPGAEAGSAERRREAVVALALAFAAAALIKVPEAFGVTLDAHQEFYARNASLAVFPLVAGYFAWKRALAARTIAWLAAAFGVSAFVMNVFLFARGSDTAQLAALHLPIALWIVVGVAYGGGRWSDGARRMDFVRFSGELFIYFVLIALGGGVLTAFTMGIFASIGA